MNDTLVPAMDSASKLIHFGDADVRLGQFITERVCILIKVSGNVLSGQLSSLAHSNLWRLSDTVSNADPVALSRRNLGKFPSDLIGQPIMYNPSSEG